MIVYMGTAPWYWCAMERWRKKQWMWCGVRWAKEWWMVSSIESETNMLRVASYVSVSVLFVVRFYVYVFVLKCDFWFCFVKHSHAIEFLFFLFAWPSSFVQCKFLLCPARNGVSFLCASSRGWIFSRFHFAWRVIYESVSRFLSPIKWQVYICELRWCVVAISFSYY